MAQSWIPEMYSATVADMTERKTSGLWREHPITKAVASKLSGIDPRRAKSIRAVLEAFANQPANGDYPPLRMAHAEDDSVIVEWVFKDRRLGFSYERDEGESGWYFVQAKRPGESGPLTNLASALPRLISRCLNAV